MKQLLFTLTLKIATILALADEASAQNQDICDQITYNASIGRVIKADAINDYQTAVRCIVPEIAKFEDDLAARRVLPRLQGGYREYLSMADALQEMISVVGRPAITEIRKVATPEFASALAAGARSPEYNIRIASSYVLSNVIDNSTACVVLDYLHAPVQESEEDNPDIYGRANLVYTLNAVVLWSYKEIFDSIVMTHQEISQRIITLPIRERNNLGSTQRGLDNVGERIERVREGGGLRSPESQISFAEISLPDDERDFCQSHKYRFWLENNPFLQ